MNRRTLSTLAVCGALLAAAAFVPTAQAGNVAWSVSVGGPGFAVSAGQPGFYGGYYRAPYLRPIAHPYYRPLVWRRGRRASGGLRAAAVRSTRLRRSCMGRARSFMRSRIATAIRTMPPVAGRTEVRTEGSR